MSELAGADYPANFDVETPEHPPAQWWSRWSTRTRALGIIWILSGIISLLTVGWLLALFFNDSLRILMSSTDARPGLEMFLALGQLFGALVLVLSSHRPPRPAMQRVAIAFLVMGLGTLVFGYLFYILDVGINRNASMYGTVLSRCLASVLIAIGLVPKRPPILQRRVGTAILLAGAAITLLLLAIGDSLPQLMSADNWRDLLATGAYRAFPGLSWPYFALSALPLFMSYIAIWGAVRHVRRDYVSGWLVVGLVLYSGSQLHAIFWPSLHSMVLTSTTVLRVMWTLTVILGGVIELYALSRERAILLEKEQERVRQLEEIDAMKRDFTSMVVHEVGTPLAAIGNLAQMISLGVLPEAEQQKAAGRILDEAHLLQILVRDFRESSRIEKDDFIVTLKRAAVRELLENGYAFAETVRRDNPITLDIGTGANIDVMADPDRIGQVIRNFTNNAVRHTPAGTPILLRAIREDGGVRIMVSDEGPGIPREDQTRILEKFGRGSTVTSAGAGLGLYLSQRILRAHSSEITIESEPGHGACFGFRLEASP